MKNDYGSGPEKISIPPTLLFSLFGDHPDVRFTATSDFKQAGDRVYLVGSSRQELGASELAFMLTESGASPGIGGTVPQLNHPEDNLATYRVLANTIRQGLVRTAHDCSEGGLAVALAEMCIGGRLGAEIDVDGTGEGDLWGRLWGESLGRIVVAVAPENDEMFRTAMKGHPLTVLGNVNETAALVVVDGDEELIASPVDALVEAWKGTLDLTGGVA